MSTGRWNRNNILLQEDDDDERIKIKAHQRHINEKVTSKFTLQSMKLVKDLFLPATNCYPFDCET